MPPSTSMCVPKYSTWMIPAPHARAPVSPRDTTSLSFKVISCRVASCLVLSRLVASHSLVGVTVTNFETLISKNGPITRKGANLGPRGTEFRPRS
eukprot:2142903-Rhodomonas_salina.1